MVYYAILCKYNIYIYIIIIYIYIYVDFMDEGGLMLKVYYVVLECEPNFSKCTSLHKVDLLDI